MLREDVSGPQRLWNALGQRPVETIAGVVMVAFGLALSRQPDWPGWAGSVLLVLGGVLLSIHPASAYAASHARDDLDGQLGNLSRQLGIASGQIDQAVSDVQGGRLSAETGLALVRNSARTLFGLVAEIRTIRGVPFDPTELLQTASALQELATELNSVTTEALDTPLLPPAGAQELERIQDQLEVLSNRLPGLGKSAHMSKVVLEQTVGCPKCGRDTIVKIGVNRGDSALGKCENCAAVFHAHRKRDGSVFSRLPGPGFAEAPSQAVEDGATSDAATPSAATPKQ